jgi:hypothetical protein
VQALRRAAEMQFLGDGHEAAKLADLEHGGIPEVIR